MCKLEDTVSPEVGTAHGCIVHCVQNPPNKFPNRDRRSALSSKNAPGRLRFRPLASSGRWVWNEVPLAPSSLGATS